MTQQQDISLESGGQRGQFSEDIGLWPSSVWEGDVVDTASLELLLSSFEPKSCTLLRCGAGSVRLADSKDSLANR